MHTSPKAKQGKPIRQVTMMYKLQIKEISNLCISMSEQGKVKGNKSGNLSFDFTVTGVGLFNDRERECCSVLSSIQKTESVVPYDHSVTSPVSKSSHDSFHPVQVLGYC